MNDTLLYPDEPPRDLPPDLQQAVRKALAATHRLNPPPRYDTHYWREEREAIANCAVWQAAQAYRAEMAREAFALLCALRAIYAEWQRLRKLDEPLVPMPVDAETGDEVEFADAEALEAIEGHLLGVQVREALARLSAAERQLVEWSFGEGLSERAIAAQLGCSHVAVHKRLRSAWKHLCELLGVEPSFPGWEPSAKGRNRRRKRGR